MGIKGLSKVIADNAPDATKLNEIKNLFGRKVAIDASMSIYQFLIAVRSADGQQLQNESGETTSHLMGLFYRTIRMVENGIKPMYVFDGHPPKMKSEELAKRGIKRADATAQMETAIQEGDQENINKFSRRTVKVTKQVFYINKHNEECQKLLDLMGIPWIQAPCEAEARISLFKLECAALAKNGNVYGVGSEDMDTLTFAAPVLLRHLTFSEAKKMPIKIIEYEKILQGLELTSAQFIDLSILLGCDYCDSIKGVGPHRAVQLIKEHKDIETIIKSLDSKKHPIPENWPYAEARKLFKNPCVTDPKTINLKWRPVNEEGLIEFMCKDHGFNEERIKKSLVKLTNCKNSSTQLRLDSFFKVIPKSKEEIAKVNAKRKATVKANAKPLKTKKRLGPK